MPNETETLGEATERAARERSLAQRINAYRSMVVATANAGDTAEKTNDRLLKLMMQTIIDLEEDVEALQEEIESLQSEEGE